ncbi:FixH family protein [Paenibacillus athensensis]|uniref:YtkA-like domain-containing protein n=1 Tax=Paenibacillus athensensis TaxID=1967502 RepID=A0A4Y8PZ02_9BACL|nr:FixH family protein [Paenibacillus athensensis]MCD1261428.1 FixH family protein [Paenibacillus athensensis]
MLNWMNRRPLAAAAVMLTVCALGLALLLLLHRTGGADEALPEETAWTDSLIALRVRADMAVGRPMQEQLFLIEAHTADGLPIDDAQIEMKLQMPGMMCGEFAVPVVRSGSGHYEARGIPVMDGRWEAEVTVQIGSGRYIVRHPFMVRR